MKQGGGDVVGELQLLFEKHLDLDAQNMSNALETLAEAGFTTVGLFKELEEDDWKELQASGLKLAVKKVRAE